MYDFYQLSLDELYKKQAEFQNKINMAQTLNSQALPILSMLHQQVSEIIQEKLYVAAFEQRDKIIPTVFDSDSSLTKPVETKTEKKQPIVSPVHKTKRPTTLKDIT